MGGGAISRRSPGSKLVFDVLHEALGLAQHWGGAIEEIRPGDVIWFSPGEKHWHGATPTTAMTHIAVQEALNGKGGSPSSSMSKSGSKTVLPCGPRKAG